MPLARADGHSAGARRWIYSPGFDLAFFVLSPLIALPVLFLSPEPSALSLVFGCVLGVPHYLSTLTFYFWDETRTQHRAQWMLFFGGPVIISAAVVGAVVFSVPFIIQVVVYVWNTVHVSRQSCGILSIYRHRAGARDPSARSVANAAIIWTAFALAFWNTPGFPALHEFMTAIWLPLPRVVSLVTAIGALIALARLGAWLAVRTNTESSPRLPELAFLATSLLLFHPYLWINDANQATLGMLLGHFIQYLAITWLVHRRKFAAAGAQMSHGWLRTLSTSLPLLILVLLGAGVISLGLRVVPIVPIRTIYAVLLLSLALVHFYLDGLFWAFRRAEVRQALGPYVMGPR